ncbi:hypothetical protein BUALT_Bualt14G0042400 [Buddleja alternifolia]|uniref:RNase H type-1 domain-containing protein n=1 Tax=Buddleja alternifolia TaxID=168488 RepID=A0AAV6WN04_9LAMI|nr:hypothetical protein BUALT_Bualt14G0042400 [Buddleja alternifolia]
MWTRDTSCKSTISDAWSKNVRGSPSFSLHSKLKSTRFALRSWNRTKFGHCQRNISLLHDLISSIQSREPTIENRHMEEALVGDLNELLMREEVMWRQRAKQKWLKKGDANTRFFHLSTIIHRRAEASNVFHGIKISRGSPSISHVMYADDLLIFGKTNDHNVDGIAEVISVYEQWSGQLVSTEKTVVHFSKKVSRNVRHSVCGKLGFQECNHKIKHLGLPFCKPATRCRDFSELIERVEKKLSSWKAKCLAHAGRNVLVKSVAQSLPVYFISLYNIPRLVCDRIDKIMRNFWWGDKDENTHIHLRSWDFICSPKEFGGLGLRRTRDMNISMVSKLAWKMCEDRPILWVNLLKAKYLRGVHFMDQNETPRTSSKIWKSIMASKVSIRKGLLFSISTQSCTRTWEDPWILTIPDFTPPSNHLTEDLKAQTYLAEFESDEHIFLHCPRSRNAWWNSKWGLRMDHFEGYSMFESIDFVMDRKNPMFISFEVHLEFLQFTACLLNRIWLNRNSLLHGEQIESVESLINHAQATADDHYQAQRSKLTNLGNSPPGTRTSLPSEFGLRVNVDAAFKEGSCCVSRVVRNEENGLLFAASRSYSAIDSKEAELLAIRFACSSLENAHFSSIIFESDCMGAVEEVNNNGEISFWIYENLVRDIKSFFGYKPGWSLCFIRRELNVVAHNLCQWGFCRKWEGPIPLDLLNEDILCNEVHIPLNSISFFSDLYN